MYKIYWQELSLLVLEQNMAVVPVKISLVPLACLQNQGICGALQEINWLLLSFLSRSFLYSTPVADLISAPSYVPSLFSSFPPLSSNSQLLLSCVVYIRQEALEEEERSHVLFSMFSQLTCTYRLSGSQFESE